MALATTRTTQQVMVLPLYGLVLTHPSKFEMSISSIGQSELLFPKDFVLVGGDKVIEGLAHIELFPLRNALISHSLDSTRPDDGGASGRP